MKSPARSRWLSAVALALAATLRIVSPAAAQTPKIDASAGYQFTRISGVGDSFNIPTGWYADLAGHLSPMASLVFEVTGAYKTETQSVSFSATQGVSAEAKARLHTFMGGARVSGHTTNTAIVPFAQVLFGAANLNASISASGAGTSLSDSQSETKTAMLLGGGVNVMASGRAGIRAAAAYRRIFIPADEGGGENDFLLQVGVVVSIPR